MKPFTSTLLFFERRRLNRLRVSLARTVYLVLLGSLVGHLPAHAQSDETEHLSHHPDVSEPASLPAAVDEAMPDMSRIGTSVPDPNSPRATPTMPDLQPGKEGMMDIMSKMMGDMGGNEARKEVYPFLINRPALTAAELAEVERLAEERIHEGMELSQSAQERLSKAIEIGDHDAAELALQQARDGTAQVDSGVAAHRLIREDNPPQRVASEWFANSMGLPAEQQTSHGLFGLTWFHYVTMFVLLAFTAMMIGLSFFRTQRTASLLSKLAGGPEPVGAPAVPVLSGATTPETKPATTKTTDPAIAKGTRSDPALVPPDIAPSKSNSWNGPLLVARIFQETHDVKTFRLANPDGGRLPFTFLPGQFLTFTVTPHGQSTKRSYTIASSPTRRDFCDVTVRHEGRGLVSGYLNDQVHEGELLQVTAPSGKFTFAGQDGSSIVLIAGGVGITPMMSVIRYLTDRSWPGDVFLIYGCKTDDDVIFREEIEFLKRRYPNLYVTLVAERADAATWPYFSGRISSELLAQVVPAISTRHIHLCGPAPMMDAVKQMLSELGVPAKQIEIEVFIGKERPQAPATSPEQSVTLDAAAQPIPTLVATSGQADAPTLINVATATFERSNKTAPLPPTKTVLEASEDVGVNIDYSCRVGTCGICKVQLLAGTVTMEVEDALVPADKAQNIILACQAKATGDVSVDA